MIRRIRALAVSIRPSLCAHAARPQVRREAYARVRDEGHKRRGHGPSKIFAGGWRMRSGAYNVSMLGAWLIGEKDEATVHLFVQCGMCRMRMPVDPEDDARSLLRAHLYCEHGAHVDEDDAT
jgi:hypothetical protein